MKKIFYYTDITPLLSKENAAIRKLEYNLSIFKENSSSVCLVWHPYVKMKEYLDKNDSPVGEDFCRVLSAYKSEGWGILDQSADPRSVAESCDAYYGDASELLYYAKEAGLPCMLINYDCLG